MIGLGRAPFDQAEGANKRPRKAITADWKVQNGALSGSAIEGGFRHLHLAHRILFDARFDRFHHTGAEEKRVAGSIAPLPLRILSLRKTVMNIGGMFCRTYSESALAKSILFATRSTSTFELGTMEAIWSGRFKNCLKNRTLIENRNSSPLFFACPVVKPA